MKKYKFTITDTNGEVHEKNASQKILSIKDTRHIQMISNNLKSITFLSVSFFEQLTLQISPCIFLLAGRELPASYCIMCVDEFFIKEADSFNILLYLSGSNYGDYLWVKCHSRYEEIFLKNEHDYKFSICTTSESMKYSKIRFEGREDVGTMWLNNLRRSFKEMSKLKKQSPLYSENYPDVIIQLQLKEEITKELKEEMVIKVQNFVDYWNCDERNMDKIHEFYPLDDTTDSHSIQIYVDFGNCEPSVMQTLITYLKKTNKKLIKVVLI